MLEEYFRSSLARRRRRLWRSYSQGREASRSTCAGSDQVRAGHQPQNCEGARARNSVVGTGRADEVIE
jgi:hypothetical protein